MCYVDAWEIDKKKKKNRWFKSNNGLTYRWVSNNILRCLFEDSNSNSSSIDVGKSINKIEDWVVLVNDNEYEWWYREGYETQNQ